jgi:hypothetical protein
VECPERKKYIGSSWAFTLCDIISSNCTGGPSGSVS